LWAPATAGSTGLGKSLIGGDVTFSGYTFPTHWNFATGLANASSRFVTAPVAATSQSWSFGAYTSALSTNTLVSVDDGTLSNRVHLYAAGAGGAFYVSSGQLLIGNGAGLYSISTGAGVTTAYRDGLPCQRSGSNSVVPTGYNYTINKGGGGYYGSAPCFGSYAASNLTDAEALILGRAWRLYQARLGRETAVTYLAFGDSITAGFSGLPSYVTQVAASAASAGKRVINGGFPGAKLSGSTFGDGILSYQTVLAAYPSARYHLQFGVNDIGGGVSAAAFQAAYMTVVGYMVNTLGISPSAISIGSPGFTTTDYGATRTAYTAAAAAVAASYGTKYADVFAAMVAGGGATLMSDGVHPNSAGHTIMANAITAAIA
jgi:lysophospholipase L1-like esterase